MVTIRSISINGSHVATVPSGGIATLFVDATSDLGGLTYQWHRYYPDTFTDSVVPIAHHTSTLIINPCIEADAGHYYCLVHDINDDDMTSMLELIIGSTTTLHPATTTTTVPPGPTTTVAPTTTLPPSVSTLKFTELEVVATKDNYHYIEWEVGFDPVGNDSADNYFFYLYTSNSPTDDFEVITNSNGAPVTIDGSTGPLAYIHRFKQYDFNLEYYYKIEAVHKHSSTATSESDAVRADEKTDGIHETIKYAEQTLYNMYQGEPILILKKKIIGTRCPKCWSPYRQQRTITDCDVCHGSGFEHGYYCPIQVQASFDSTPKKNDLNETNEDMTNYIRCRVSNYPLIRPKDIIVNKDSYVRYIVISIEITKLPLIAKARQVLSKQNYVLSQIMTLKEINPADPQYHIPLPDRHHHHHETPRREEYIFDGGTAETGDFIWYIDGNTGRSL